MEAGGVALVTGAGRGLGRAVALALAGAGFDVVASMRHPEGARDLLEEAEGVGRLSLQRLDVTDPSTIELPDGLKVLVNNAGIERASLPVEAAPRSDWQEVFATNVFGLAEVTRRAVPLLRAQGGGVICNITSASLYLPVPFYGVYRASKAAVAALGETLATEVAPFGIRVIEVPPGPVSTDMLAASDRPPEAGGAEGYEDLASALYEGRRAINESVTPVDEAAAAICAAICAADGPLRQPCDALGRQLLEAWQAAPDTMLAAPPA
jgi:NAD(P)-dependent dehydrogenase (short-subunit alcohol dehydrogenase family)